MFFTDPAQYRAPPPKPKEPTPEEEYIKIQGQKVQMDARNDMGKLSLEKEKMIRLDDREKDRNETQAQLSIMDMEAKYNTKLDTEKIKANLERNREEAKEREAMMKAHQEQKQQQAQQQQQMQAQQQAQAQQQQGPPQQAPQMPPNA